MQKYFKSVFAKCSCGAFQKIVVLKRSAAEAHAVYFFFSEYPQCHFKHDSSDRVMEAGGNGTR